MVSTGLLLHTKAYHMPLFLPGFLPFMSSHGSHMTINVCPVDFFAPAKSVNVTFWFFGDQS